MKSLYFVIVTYNSEKDIFDCIMSINRYIGVDNNVIVIDNNSLDNTVKKIKENFTDLQLIQNNKNSGFSKAVNMGIKNSTRDIVVLLNPDARFVDNSIENAIVYMEENPDVGIIGGKVVDENGRFQHTCRRGEVNPLSILYRDLGLHRLLGKKFDTYNLIYLDIDKITEVESLSGSFMLIRKELIDKIGLFDETFFMFGEDIDFCLRAKKAGFKVIYYPFIKIIHIGGQSARKRRFKSHWDIHISNIKLFNKHYTKNFITKGIITFIIFVRFFIFLPLILLKKGH